MPRIRFITFDLDNTLWDVGTVIRRAEASMNAWLATDRDASSRSSSGYSSRSVSRHDGSVPTMSVPRCACGVSASTFFRAQPFAFFSWPLEMSGLPQQPRCVSMLTL